MAPSGRNDEIRQPQLAKVESSYSSANVDGRGEFWARSLEASDPERMATSHAELTRELPHWVFANCWGLSEIGSAAFKTPSLRLAI